MPPYTAEELALFDVMEDKRLIRLGIDPDASYAEITAALKQRADELTEREQRDDLHPAGGDNGENPSDCG